MTENEIIEAYVYKLLFLKKSISIKNDIETINGSEIIKKYFNDPQKSQIILKKKSSSLDKEEKMALLNNFINNEELLIDYIQFAWDSKVPQYIYIYIFKNFIDNEDMLFKLFKCNSSIYDEKFIKELKVSNDVKDKLNTILTLVKLN